MDGRINRSYKHIPFLAALLPNNSDQSVGKSILFKVVEKSNNYSSRDDVTSHGPLGKCSKSYKLPIVCIPGLYLGEGGLFDPESLKRSKV